MTNRTTAEQIAEAFGNDGLKFQHADGRELDEVAREAAASVTYARVLARHDDEEERVIEVSRGDIRDRTRYLFEDGSAIVVSGDAWDIEGETPFSWAGA